MFVISRKVGQGIYINNDIKIVVIEIRGDKVRLGFDAPEDVRIVRDDAKDRTPRNGERTDVGQLIEGTTKTVHPRGH